MLAAAVSGSPALTVAKREPLFADRFDGQMPHRNYDVTRDGKRFVMLRGARDAPQETVVLHHWLPEQTAQLRGPR